MIVPDDEQCIQQMLGIDIIPVDIEAEYMIRARMLHRQLSGGPIGPVAIVDLLRSLGYGPPPPSVVDQEGRVDWRRVEIGTAVQVRIGGEWKPSSFGFTFQGEVGAGTLAVKHSGRIDEFNRFDVRIDTHGLPSDVDKASFEGKPSNVNEADARLDLIDRVVSDATSHETPSTKVDASENEVESSQAEGDIGSDDEIPVSASEEVKVNWGQVKKGTEVWYRDGADLCDAKFVRCLKDGQAFVLIAEETEPRQVARDQLQLP